MKREEHANNLRMVEYLSQWFIIEQEVYSVDDKCRIDIVLHHKSDTDFTCPIGIESKRPAEKITGYHLGLWLKQAIRYSGSQFISFTHPVPHYLLICAYPQWSYHVFEEGNQYQTKHNVKDHGFMAYHHNVNGFLGSLGIGELQKYYHLNQEKCRIVYNTRLLWDERTDIFNKQTKVK